MGEPIVDVDPYTAGHFLLPSGAHTVCEPILRLKTVKLRVSKAQVAYLWKFHAAVGTIPTTHGWLSGGGQALTTRARRFGSQGEGPSPQILHVETPEMQ